MSSPSSNSEEPADSGDNYEGEEECSTRSEDNIVYSSVRLFISPLSLCVNHDLSETKEFETFETDTEHSESELYYRRVQF